jgi:hypothetical protein
MVLKMLLRLHVYTQKAYKLSIVQHFEGRIAYTPLSVNVFVTLAVQYPLEYYCKALFETPCTISLSLSLFLSVFCAACQCFETLFSVLNTCHFLKSLKPLQVSA